MHRDSRCWRSLPIMAGVRRGTWQQVVEFGLRVQNNVAAICFELAIGFGIPTYLAASPVKDS